MNEQQPKVPATDREPQFAGHLAAWDEAARHRHARRLLLKSALFAPVILTSVLTTKAVAATKVVMSTSVPLSL